MTARDIAPLPSSRDLLRALFIRLMAANAVAGVAVTTYLFLTVDLPDGASRVGAAAIAAVSFVSLTAMFGSLALRRAARIAAAEWAWMDERREPTDDERARLLNAPRMIGLLPLPYWGAVAVIVAAGQLFAGAGLARSLTQATSTILGALTACLLSYFLAEGGLRHVIARVTAVAERDASTALGVQTRLLLAWALGSALPLGGILLTPVVRERTTDVPLVVPVVFLAAVGLVYGLRLTWMATSSVARPLADLRAGMAAVQAGRLDVEVPVDDPGEIGQLQAGFNRMVDGLRERQRVQDLFGRHVGPEVAHRILDRGANLGGESREVTVFFVDIVGSTAFAEERPPHEVVELLNDFFSEVVAAASHEGGWIDDFQGDGALCVFGVLDDHPDHAARALRAARDLRVRLEKLRRRRRDLDAGIGVATGTVVAGNVGSQERLEYTVIGSPVNEAARLTDAAKQCDARLLASADVVRAAGTEAECWRPAGTVRLRGVAGTIAVCEPLPDV